MKTEYTITIKDIYGKDLVNLTPPKGYKFNDFRYPREGEKYYGLGVFQPIEAIVNHNKRTSPPYLILTPTPKVKELVYREFSNPTNGNYTLQQDEIAISPETYSTYGKHSVVSSRCTLYRLHSRREVDSDE